MSHADRKTWMLHFFPLDADGSLWDPTGKGPNMDDVLFMPHQPAAVKSKVCKNKITNKRNTNMKTKMNRNRSAWGYG